jgi:hypothetical protein
MLGQDVVRALGDEAVALSRTDLDVTDAAAVREALVGTDVVVNCAAWTNVDGAEEHSDEALAVNRDGARNVAGTRATSSSARPGSSARGAATSSTRCCGWVASGTRSGWSTTRSVAPRSPAT